MSVFLVWLALAGPALVDRRAQPSCPGAIAERRADPRLAGLGGGLWGAALGAVALPWLHRRVPALRRGSPRPPPSVAADRGARVALRPGVPDEPLCHGPALRSGPDPDRTNGRACVYATMAVGLTLIYSVQRIVSFTHGQFVMFGGVTAFLLLRDSPWSPYAVLPVVGLAAFVLGVGVAAVLLRPVQAGTVERPDEYAILMTFGFGLFLTYALVGTLGAPVAVRTPRYTDRPLFGLDTAVVELGGLRFRIDLRDRRRDRASDLLRSRLGALPHLARVELPGGLDGSHRVGRLGNRRRAGSSCSRSASARCSPASPARRSCPRSTSRCRRWRRRPRSART